MLQWRKKPIGSHRQRATLVDYFDLERLLSQEERLIQETARECVTNTVQSKIADHWQAGTFPRDIITEMATQITLVAEYSPMRHVANTETVYTYEETHDIHTLVVDHSLTGIPAFE